MNLKRAALFLILAAGLTLCATFLYWRAAVAEMDRAIEGWLQAWRAQGYRIETGPRAPSGFPFQARIAAEAPSIEDPEGAWRWTARGVDIETDLWDLTRYRLRLGDRHDLAAPINGRIVDMRITPETADLETDFDLNGQLRKARLRLTSATVSAPEIGASGRLERAVITLVLPKEPATRHDQESAAIELIAQGVTLPPDMAGPLGPSLAHVSTRLRVMGAAPRADLRGALAAWRDGGGVIEAPWLRLNWGPLGVNATGTATIDEKFRPLAAFDVKARGYKESIDAFADAGLIDRQVGRWAGLGLQIFAGLGGGEVSIPVSAQDGAVFLGPLRMGDAPPLLPAQGGDRLSPAPAPSAVIVQPQPAPLNVPAPEAPPTLDWR